jgi:hypothetical protein
MPTPLFAAVQSASAFNIPSQWCQYITQPPIEPQQSCHASCCSWHTIGWLEVCTCCISQSRFEFQLLRPCFRNRPINDREPNNAIAQLLICHVSPSIIYRSHVSVCCQVSLSNHFVLLVSHYSLLDLLTISIRTWSPNSLESKRSRNGSDDCQWL